jgi:uncharacterized membrane protein
MSYDFAVSMEGIRTAQRSLSDAAQKIANVNSSATQKEQGTDQDDVTLSGGIDLAAALQQARQAKIAAKANMNLLSAEHELEQTAMDMIG